jgi:hypothetical protein
MSAEDPARGIMTIRPFFDGALEMRAVFDSLVGPHRTADTRRFVWDYWHVPEQYTYMRTFAHRAFPPALHRRFTAAVRRWGEKQLGCGQISEPWLSYYIDGCRQELHADVPQGPWAFVFSLTHWADRRFTGGETVLARPTLLDFWAQYDSDRPLERKDLVERIPAEFNQLVVFDARVPHGVATVEGSRDPIESRVVLHGWFRPPRITLAGSLRSDDVEPALSKIRAAWNDELQRAGSPVGVTTWRVHITPDGTVETVERLAHTLIASAKSAAGPALALESTARRLQAARFPRAAGRTTVLLPLNARNR